MAAPPLWAESQSLKTLNTPLASPQPPATTAQPAATTAQPAATTGQPPATTAQPSATSEQPFALPSEPTHERDLFLPPLASLFLPGFDQWWEGQYAPAVGFSSVAVAGTLYQAANIVSLKHSVDQGLLNPDEDLRARKALLGGLIAQGSGGLSAYYSFRSAVTSRQAHGEFGFLKHQESVGELLVAPLRFDYLLRPTSFVPIGIAAALHFAATAQNEGPSGTVKQHLRGSDVFFAGSYSFNAGTHEEAVFRGWLMPLLAYYTGNDTVANGIQAALFAVAHVPTTPQPWPQFLLGGYLGYLTEKREWTLSESVFIHTWWDVFAFLTTYEYRKQTKAALPPMLLPALELHF